MFDSEYPKEETLEPEISAIALPEIEEEPESSGEKMALDAEKLLSADLAGTALLTRPQEEALTRRIALARKRVTRVLRSARRLCKAALVEMGRGVIAPEEDFRERETIAILTYAQAALRDSRLIRATGLGRPRLRQFIEDLSRALDAYRELRDEMVRANVRLVNLFARRYHHPTLTALDLFQEGTIGLLRAIEKYDPERNIKFSTYATWWIWQQVSRAADTYGSMIRLPVHWNQFRRRLSRDEREIASENEGKVSRQELAASQGLDAERFEAMAQSFHFVSTDTPVSEDDDRTLESVLASDSATPDEEAMRVALRQRLEAALSQLAPRERTIVRHRFGLDEDQTETLEELGQQFGVSRERIRQLESRGLKQLREICAADGLQEYLH